MQIDELMPSFDLRTRHERIIAATPSQIYSTAKTMTIRKLRSVRMLLFIREIFSRLNRQPLESFPVVAENPGREIVMAICGKFWAISGNILDVPVQDINHFSRPGYAKAYWNFYLEPMGKGQTRLITETRVQIYGDAERKKFALYWRLVGPFSGWIRTQILKAIEREALLVQTTSTSAQVLP